MTAIILFDLGIILLSIKRFAVNVCISVIFCPASSPTLRICRSPSVSHAGIKNNEQCANWPTWRNMNKYDCRPIPVYKLNSNTFFFALSLSLVNYSYFLRGTVLLSFLAHKQVGQSGKTYKFNDRWQLRVHNNFAKTPFVKCDGKKIVSENKSEISKHWIKIFYMNLNGNLFVIWISE